MGTRIALTKLIEKLKDHPHAYGDKVCTTTFVCTLTGSSPRVWGQAVLDTVALSLFGIIPTRMGTRLFKPFNLFGKKDHPHAYGDKRFTTFWCIYRWGSSPRVWGQAWRLKFILPVIRIIPTRMGTSFFLSIFLTEEKDHPHAYGDKSIRMAQ